ncbi:NAD(P)/FAD-dependent oxidoreductase [Ilumatobacter sp.]|uniref:NAD(P)/FAD-dependent oxidoreductase n=1 Tax=Ilumatobacter sp. TaxID=1967498 RepID=UPI003B51A847
MRSGSDHHVVVIGAGFGGLNVIRALRDAPVRITVVDSNNFHTFQPLLYQVATAGLSADDVAHPVRSIFPRSRTSTVDAVMATVVDIDTAAKILTTDGEVEIGYDTLVVAAGAVSADFGVDGVDRHAFPLKSLDDALAVNRHLISTFESAARRPSDLVEGALDVAIVGGGPTGVEMAGGVAELFANVLADDFPELAVDDARVHVIEMADRVLSPFSEVSSRRARDTLEALGVEVRTGSGVERVEADGVVLDDGTRVAAGTIIWAAGVEAHPVARSLGVELTGAGRIPVDADLSVTGVDDVFAIGDVAAVEGVDGDVLPQVAQPAIQGGRHVAEQIERRLDGRSTVPFTYSDRGSMATIGRHSAVADLPGGIHLGGLIGWVGWLVLHLVYLIGFRNRLVVFVNWCWNYVTSDRPSRLLSGGAVSVDRELEPHDTSGDGGAPG